MAACDVQSALPDNLFPTKDVPTLHSNQGNHINPASTGWMQSVTTDTPKEEMRARYNRDGYLWVKNLIPREEVLDMREQ